VQWLGEHPYILVPLGVLIGLLIWKTGTAALRMLGAEAKADSPHEVHDVEDFDVRYRCVVCATEVRLTRISTDEGDDFAAPKHCQEKMALVVEAQ
jgi:hypothetical protein